MDQQTIGHSRFGASAAHRWMRCPASVQACMGLPNPSSPAAEEGTMLHEVAANTLYGLSHDYLLTDEQQDVVDAYVNFVKAQTGNGELYIETRFKLSYHSEFWGTADAVIVRGDDMHVIDLKAGRGVAVEADYHGKVNPQLGFYALGACSYLKRYDWNTIKISIVQPRFGGIKTRVVTHLELMDLASDMVHAAELAESEKPPFEAGSHCKFCLARSTCPALREMVYELARMDFDAVV